MIEPLLVEDRRPRDVQPLLGDGPRRDAPRRLGAARLTGRVRVPVLLQDVQPEEDKTSRVFFEQRDETKLRLLGHEDVPTRLQTAVCSTAAPQSQPRNDKRQQDPDATEMRTADHGQGVRKQHDRQEHR